MVSSITRKNTMYDLTGIERDKSPTHSSFAVFSPHLCGKGIEIDKFSPLELGVGFLDRFNIFVGQFQIILIDHHLRDRCLDRGLGRGKVAGFHLCVKQFSKFRAF